MGVLYHLISDKYKNKKMTIEQVLFATKSKHITVEQAKEILGSNKSNNNKDFVE